MNATSFFHTEGVSDDEAIRVATFLAAVGLFNDSPKVAQLSRCGEGLEFRLAVDVDPLTDEMTAGQQKMAADLSREVLGGVPVQVRYCKGLVDTLQLDRAYLGTNTNEVAAAPKGRSYRSQNFRVPHKLAGDDEQCAPSE
jgi:hypothetical protein